ncbi:hypothetical protein WRSd3_03759 [Shigella dysenteriae WRSd3]|uniref:Uncharacterized protein n=2 Tax=Shigella dysenteriae TaxID=622 RepID=A0A090N9B9_SHIDY|nr:Hypothetical protein Asd1617_06267 [Shigella dysenteriae 1617]ESU75961.1 hypothetical protein WRSd3_p00113 [Shigella dysenteriae WRSd3]ESU77344.1 hypothetical protein WRSd3_03759 [Shigella dysenteriae WRSd3]
MRGHIYRTDTVAVFAIIFTLMSRERSLDFEKE